MSHLTECIGLYRDDIAVTDDQFAAFMLDAVDRDREAFLRAELNADADPFAAFGFDSDGAHKLNAVTDEPPIQPVLSAQEAADYLQGLSSRPMLADLMTPEESARYLLIQFQGIQKTLDLLAAADGGLIELDAKQDITIAALAERLEHLENRMDLRAEECQALSARIESVTRQVTGGAHLRPA